MLVADIAHISGLIAGGAHPSPVGKAEIITSTTHKTFRGPRGGMILCDDKHRAAIDKAVFPGLQGGPHNGTTAAIAVAAKEADTDAFKNYAKAVVSNAKAWPKRYSRAALSSSPAAPTITCCSPISRRKTSPARSRPRRSIAPASSATTTRSRSIRASRSTRAASASARRPSPAAAWARPK